jgi:hypothetical protein
LTERESGRERERESRGFRKTLSTASSGFCKILSAGDLQTSLAEEDVSNPRKREDPDLLCSSCERVREVVFSSPNSFLVWEKSEDEPRRWARACLVLCGDGRVLMVADARKALLSDEAQEIGNLVAACSQVRMGNRESNGGTPRGKKKVGGGARGCGIASGCDCDKPSAVEEAQRPRTSSATDSQIGRQEAKARSHQEAEARSYQEAEARSHLEAKALSHLEAQMPLSLGHGKDGEGGAGEEDDWPEGGEEDRQEGEEEGEQEGVGKTWVQVTPLLQDVLPGLSLTHSLWVSHSLSLSLTLSLSHAHTLSLSLSHSLTHSCVHTLSLTHTHAWQEHAHTHVR